MGCFQNSVFHLFGGNSECIFPRFILNADSSLHLLFQSSGIHLYLKSCSNRARMNSRSWEQKVMVKERASPLPCQGMGLATVSFQLDSLFWSTPALAGYLYSVLKNGCLANCSPYEMLHAPKLPTYSFFLIKSGLQLGFGSWPLVSLD